MTTAQTDILSFKRSIVNAHILLSVAQAKGMSPTAMLSGCTLTGQDLRNPTGLISARDELQMIRNLLARHPLSTGVGLAVGAKYHLAAFGVWGFALASSATVGEAVNLSLAHSAMIFAFSRLSLEEHGDRVHWYFDDPGMPEDLAVFSTERDMAALGSVSHDLLGSDFEAHEIWFSYPEPKHAALYKKYFNGPIRFSAPRSGFVLSSSLLALPLQVPDEVLKQAESSELRSEPQGIRDRVCDLLFTNLKDSPTMAAVADALRMTPRTLRRKLENEGTTFRQLADEVRCSRARELLEHTSMSIDEVSHHLAYADASSFSQAFRRLTGVSPAAYRQSKRQATD